uniref:Uncharacterized protein n=1 Tax=Rhizophagus irregularis (strain DAOM 181602 / DAOM 197198 / MUCL 43194) TaxID=747089 RepID=U9UWR5_RHIID
MISLYNDKLVEKGILGIFFKHNNPVIPVIPDNIKITDKNGIKMKQLNIPKISPNFLRNSSKIISGKCMIINILSIGLTFKEVILKFYGEIEIAYYGRIKELGVRLYDQNI